MKPMRTTSGWKRKGSITNQVLLKGKKSVHRCIAILRTSLAAPLIRSDAQNSRRVFHVRTVQLKAASVQLHSSSDLRVRSGYTCRRLCRCFFRIKEHFYGAIFSGPAVVPVLVGDEFLVCHNNIRFVVLFLLNRCIN